MFKIERTSDGYQVVHVATGKRLSWGLTRKQAEADVKCLLKMRGK